MAVTNNVQLGRDGKVFAVEETTKGTLAHPTDSDMIIPSGKPEFNQQPSYTPTTELRGTRSMRTRFVDQNPAGTWSLPMYCRPAGAGNLPDGHVLLLGAFGSHTVHGSTSVTYELSNDNHITSTIYVGLKDMVFALIGSTVNEFKCAVTNKGGLNLNFSGGFMTMAWAGKADITGESAGVFTVSAADAKKFCVGMRIKIWDASAGSYFADDGGYYTISAVGTTSVTTDAPGAGYTYGSGDWIEGYLPSGTETGTAVEARTGSFYLDGMDGTSIPIQSAEATLVNNIKYLEDEISTALYPTAFIADTRDAKANANLYLRTNDLKYFKDSGLLASADKVQGNLSLQGGDTTGYKMALQMPIVESSVPTLSGDVEQVIAMEFQGLASASYNDEMKLTFY